MNRTRWYWMLPVALAGALALAGCGHAPTAPVVSPTSTSLGMSSDGLYLSPTEEPQAPLPQNTAVTALIHGRTGGTLVVGRFTLTIPSGAFLGNATVTLNQPDLNLMVVRVQVSPANKSSLQSAATLTADARLIPASDLSQAAIWSWDAVSGTFQPLAGSSVNVAGKTVQAPLSSLSTMAKVQKL